MKDEGRALLAIMALGPHHRVVTIDVHGTPEIVAGRPVTTLRD
jgi:hypothetical protein